MKIGCPGRDCSLIALPRTRRTPRTVGRYLPEKIGFPDWCVRVCRPYDACKRFGITTLLLLWPTRRSRRDDEPRASARV